MADEDEKAENYQTYLNRQRDESDALWRAMKRQIAEMNKHNRKTNEFVDFVYKKRKEQKKVEVA
jgi:hypothetical protein